MANTDVNSVVLVGRLVRDAELRYTNGGMAIASFSVAVNRNRKDGDQWISESNFFDVSYFGKGAEAVKPYLTKGKQIAVQGSLKQDRWEKDGQKFSKVSIHADSVELLGGRSEGSPSGNYGNNTNDNFGGYQQSYSGGNHTSSNNGFVPSDSADAFGGDNSGFPEDIPF